MKTNPHEVRFVPDCPRCGGSNIIPVQYGSPSPEFSERAANGEIHLGGCVMTSPVMKDYCKDCEKMFNSPEPMSARDWLIQRIAEIAILTGDFTLKSGRKSRYYFDKYRMLRIQHHHVAVHLIQHFHDRYLNFYDQTRFTLCALNCSHFWFKLIL